MKLYIVFFLVLATFNVFAQQKEVYQATIVSYIEEEASTTKQGDYYIKEVQCTAYCDYDEQADNKLVAEAKGKSSSLSIAARKASLNCKSQLAKQCSESAPKTVKKQNAEAPFSCDWLDGKKLLGTATHKSVSCKSTVCSGEVICTGGKLKEPISKFITCEAKDNKCPSAIDCAADDQVKELQEGNFKINYDSKSKSGAKSE